MKRSPAELNALPAADFTAWLGGVYEHSPWIAAAAATRRPFHSPEDLRKVMAEVVDAAPAEAQLALIRAHPDLAGRLARPRALSPESTREQTAAGLDALSSAEVEELSQANHAYREKFGFPFIICARNQTANSILSAIAERLDHDVTTERATALEEIHQIARLRLNDLLCPEN